MRRAAQGRGRRGKQRWAAGGAALAVLFSSAAAGAQELTRGPYLQWVTESSIHVVFDLDVAAQAEVRFGVAGDLGAAVTSSAASHHDLRLEGLEPDSRYDYAVYLAGAAASPVASFRTALGAPGPFRFLAFGDTRSDPVAHGLVVQQMATEEDARFVLHTGDLVSDGEVAAQWQEFFQIEQPLIASVPFYAVLGNHEVAGGLADYYFDYLVLPDQSPAPEAYYSFDYGNVHFIGLDSHINADDYFTCLARDIDYDLCFNEGQLGWLTADLDASSQNESIDHTVVMIHVGPYTSKQDRQGNPQIRELLDLFAEKGVTLLISGHDHYYERGEAGNGIPYLILGGGGAPLYEISDPSVDPHTVIYNAPIHHYAVMDVEGMAMHVTVKDSGGQTLDTVTVQGFVPPAPAAAEPPASDAGGCGCRVAAAPSPSWAAWLLGALLVATRRRARG